MYGISIPHNAQYVVNAIEPPVFRVFDYPAVTGGKNGGKTMKHKGTKNLAILLALALLFALVPGLSGTAYADSGSDYTFSIPSSLTVQNAGENAAGNISVTALTSGKKLTVSAASTNGWALKSGDNSVGYSMSKTSWEYTAAGSEAFSITVDDYSSKPAGTYTDTVTFTAAVENAGIPVESVTITNAPTKALFVNSTGTLTATVSPNDATDKTVTWSSSDPDYVSINETTGEYTIMGKKGYGSATITATAGDKTATCTITGKVHHTSLQAGDIIRVGETIYTGGSWSVNIKPSTTFGTSAGVITLVEKETNGKLYYKFNRGSNNSTPNWTSFRVKDNTDGLYIVSGTGTSSDKFVFGVHTK